MILITKMVWLENLPFCVWTDIELLSIWVINLEQLQQVDVWVSVSEYVLSLRYVIFERLRHS